MRILIRTLKWLIIVIGSLALLLVITGNSHVLRGLTATYLIGKSRPDIDDFDQDACRKVPMGAPQPWPFSTAQGETILTQQQEAYMDSLQTTAFLVIWKDSILFERYALEGGVDVLSNSFSMAKTFTSMAIGAAVDRGTLSVDDPVKKFLPRFDEGLNAKLTVEQLLQMRSNIDFGESYSNPFGYQARAYYGTDLLAETAPYRVSANPGTTWEYQGGNTVLLAEIFEARTKKKMSDWFSECFWKRIGAEHDAWWKVDHEGGIERSFSAFYATARDFARIGKLFLHDGKWNGVQVLSGSYCEASIAPQSVKDKEGNIVRHYGYQWWLAPDENPRHYSARGMRGQYIVVVPDKDLVFVRLGHMREEKKGGTMSPDLGKFVSIALGLIPEK